MYTCSLKMIKCLQHISKKLHFYTCMLCCVYPTPVLPFFQGNGRVKKTLHVDEETSTLSLTDLRQIEDHGGSRGRRVGIASYMYMYTSSCLIRDDYLRGT